ncbi:hypothetical protein SAMN06297251_1421 [Fulvimarina manganoxydans]|uniref:Uncharacterized protein n=1 Tax=Fulvimarina manganoxydans TaxID=937218 RepID=A0A1W2EXP0_9HYPH|nr:hypothetical protein SAMN06297251_1421 [Fulvimarina manganoxydans]
MHRTVEDEAGGGEARGRRSVIRIAADAHEHADAGEHFGDAEGLGDVIVCAGVQRLDLSALGLADGKYEDRHLRPLPDPADHFLAVDVRQAEVEDDKIRRLRGALGNAVLAAHRLDDGKAMGFEGDAQ